MKKGLTQVYFGNGKGKTTCAIGQVVRALGHGFNIAVFQFLKCDKSGERLYLENSGPNIKFFCANMQGFLFNMDEEEKQKAIFEQRNLMSLVNSEMKNNDIVVLDEILGAIETGVFSEDEIAEIIKSKPDSVELILTGRKLPESIEDLADLVTEIKEKKHYYNSGEKMRKGIEY